MNTILISALTIISMAWIGSLVAVFLVHQDVAELKIKLGELRGEVTAHRATSRMLTRNLVGATTNFYSFMRKHRHAAVTVREFEKQQRGEPASVSTRYGIVPSAELRDVVRGILGELHRRNQEEAADAAVAEVAPQAVAAASDCACGTGACSADDAEEEVGAPGMDAPVEDFKPAYRPRVEHCAHPGRNGCSSRTSPTADV